MDAGRATRQNNATWIEFADLFVCRREGPDFAVNAAFAHAAGDKLRYLASEIQNEDAVFVERFVELRDGGGVLLGQCDGLAFRVHGAF